MERSDDPLGRIVRRGYALIFAFVFIFYVGMSALPPYLMAAGHETAGSVLYKGFRFLCHQYPWRSWFLYGEQSYYPLYASAESGIMTFEEASGSPADAVDPRNFFGTPEMGYKMAICQRDVTIYLAMTLFCVIFFLRGNRLKRLDWRLWVLLGLLPMGVDGISQLISHVLPAVFPLRESTPLLRSVTGALFGFFTGWYLFPFLEQSLEEK